MRGMTHMAELLPVYTIDLKVRAPELGLNPLGRGILEVGKCDVLASNAVPKERERWR